jgi:hypothetical protein
VGTPIVRREHLDVLGVAAAVRPEELDLKVGKLDTSVGVRQIVVLGPSAHVIPIAAGPAVAVRPAAVGLLEEHLIFTAKVLLEAHALDMRALFDQALRSAEICPIELRVVNQLTLTGKAVVKCLSWFVIWGSMRFKEFAPSLGEGHELGPGFPIDGGDVPNQPLRSEVFEVAVPQIRGTVALVAEVIDRDYPKCADRGECANLGAAQVVLFVADRHGLPLESARQVEALREDIARIDRI